MITLRVIRVAILLATKGRRYAPALQLKMIRNRWPNITHAEVRAAERLSRTLNLGRRKPST